MSSRSRPSAPMSTPPWRPPSASSPDAPRARDDRQGAARVDLRAPHPAAPAADAAGARLPGGDLALHPARLPVRPGVLRVRHGRAAGARSGEGLLAPHLADPPLQSLHPRGPGPDPRARHVDESTPTEGPGPLGPTLGPRARPEPTPRMNDMRIRAAGRPGG